MSSAPGARTGRSPPVPRPQAARPQGTQPPQVAPRPAAPRAPLPPLVFPESLPVSALRDEIAAAIRAHPVVIVCGETGSGKTTQLPKICAMAGGGTRGLIGHTQPRRIAATTVARRIAEEIGTPLGEHVGYKIRFTEKVSPRSTIKLMTDGILLAETLSDPQLRAYDTIIVDEAHERSLNIDFLLGYLKQLVDGPRRNDLKVLITSATIDADRFARHFGSRADDGTVAPAPVVEVSGRLYPVEVRWRPLDAPRVVPSDDDGDGTADEPDAETDEVERDLPTAIEHAIDECWREQRGDVLVFLPGEREIRDAQQHLARVLGPAAGGRRGPVEILPLYSRLSAAEQDRVFTVGDTLRVVLATNVAETSLTVPGIRYVVDSGLARVKRYRFRSRVEQLQVERISRAAAAQRAGRCGRVAEGVCVRLYAEEDFAKRVEFTEPEVLRSSLAGVILRMKALRLADIDAFPFLDPPPRRAIVEGHALLAELGAIDESDTLTTVGRQLARLPLDPRIGRMLLAARERGCLPEMLVIAAALSTQDPRERPMDAQAAADAAHARFADERSDFVAFLRLWRFWKRSAADGGSNRARDAELKRGFLSPRRLREWGEVHSQLRSAIEELGGTPRDRSGPQGGPGGPDSASDPFAWLDGAKPDEAQLSALHQALLTGLVGTVGMRAQDEPHYLGTHATRFFIHPGSGLSKRGARWVMAAELVDTTRLYARNVARVDPDWIERAAGHLLKKTWSEPHWEKRAGQVVALERATLYGLVIYAGRRVHFAHKEPALARETLIRCALVEGDWESKLPFLAHNRRLIREIEALEQKLRRPDLLVDDELLHGFYDARIPAHVVSGQALEQWWREASKAEPKLLFLSRDELLRKEAGGVSGEAFPRRIEMRGVGMALEYVFEPGTPRDGVTLTVPLYALNQVDAARCDWLVPGMLHGKVVALLKSLPPKLRHRCQPVAENAQRFCDEAARAEAGSEDSGHGDDEGDERAPSRERRWRPLLDALSEHVRGLTQLRCEPSDFRVETLTAHLFMRFSVIDEHGRELAASRNLAQLKSELGGRAQTQFREALKAAARAEAAPSSFAAAELRTAPAPRSAPSPERASGAAPTASPAPTTGSSGSGPSVAAGAAAAATAQAAGQRFTDWKLGELPQIMELERRAGGRTETLIGFPALVDVGDAAELQVFDDPDEAARRHRAGVRRLLTIALKEPLRHLERSIPDFPRMGIAFAPFGTADELRRHLVDATLDRAAMADPLPHDAASFSARLAQARPRIGLVGQELARQVAAVLQEHAQLARKLAQHAKAWPAAVADVEQQVRDLLPSRWIVETDVARMPHLVRYLKAASVRLDKIKADPARDATAAAELSPLLQGWRRALSSRKGQPDARLDDFGWLLEELRVSLFAQELRTAVPVSVKRLHKVWESLRA